MKIRIHALTICALMALITFSSVAEDNGGYLRQPMPERWIHSGADVGPLPDDVEWWKTFGDPVLDSIVALGIERNLNLSQAARRVKMARLSVASARSAYFPTIGISTGYARKRNVGEDSNLFSLGADMNWEIDLFGKITSQVKAGKASAEVSRAEYRGALVSIIAEIATCYINYRVYQTELEVAKMHLESQASVLKITEARYEAGLVSKLDVAQARVVYGNTEAVIPQLESSIEQTFNALAIMLDEYPENFSIPGGNEGKLPMVNRSVSTGMPMNLLRRRPDIAQAEAQLAVYAARTGIARKDFLPTLSLEGSIGFSSPEAGQLFEGRSLSYSIGPTLSWTIFEGLGRKYALESAKEQMQAGIDNYNLTVMTAVEEVNNAMSAYSAALRTVDKQLSVLDDSHEAFNLSIDLYKQGLTPFTNVENAQISWLNCANSLVTSQGNALVSLINLYKALGGSPLDHI